MSVEDDEISSFSAITEGLLALGAIPLSRYKTCLPTEDPSLQDDSATVNAAEVIKAHIEPNYASSPHHTLAYLYQSAHRLYGQSSCFEFAYEEDADTKAKRCTLTVTLPSGASRTFQTEYKFAKDNEAKAVAAVLACEEGVIKWMASDPSAPKNVVIPVYKHQIHIKTRPDRRTQSSKRRATIGISNSPEASRDESTPPTSALDGDSSPIQEIERLCSKEWPGEVTPSIAWYYTSDPRAGDAIGCALKVSVGPTVTRVYSVDCTYPNRSSAQVACAQLALAQDVLRFIEQENASSEPPVKLEDEALPDAEDAGNPKRTPITVQQFRDSLPSPLPEPFNTKGADEVHPIGWLNQTIQTAKGCRLSVQFQWIQEATLHGCLLRLNRQDHDTISYLVEPRFAKRQEAKAAVAFQAISEGIADTIRKVMETFEDKMTVEMRRKASEEVLPALVGELRKIKPHANLPFIHEYTDGAHAARLTLDLGNNITKTFRVPAEYKTKSDAKLALVLLAAEQGALDFIRYRGGPIPRTEPANRLPPPLGTSQPQSVKKSVPSLKKDGNDHGGFNKPSLSKGKAKAKPRDHYHQSSGTIPQYERPPLSWMPKVDDSLPNSEGDAPPLSSRSSVESSTLGQPSAYLPGNEHPPGPSSHSREIRGGFRGGDDVYPLHPAPFSQYSAGDYGEVPHGSPSMLDRHLGGFHDYHVSRERRAAYLSEGDLDHPYDASRGYGESREHLEYRPRYIAESRLYPDVARPPSIHRSVHLARGDVSDDNLARDRWVPESFQRSYPDAPDSRYRSDWQPPLGNSSRPTIPPPFEPVYPVEHPANRDGRKHKASPEWADGRFAGESSRPRGIPFQTNPSKRRRVSLSESWPNVDLKVTQLTEERPYVTELNDYCRTANNTMPSFHSEAVSGEPGEIRHKVWAIVGRERMELPLSYPSIEEGEERVAKEVLSMMRRRDQP